MRQLGTSSLAFALAVFLTGCSPSPLAEGVDGGVEFPPDAAPDLPDGQMPDVNPFEEWSACMTQANWDTALMGAWAGKPSSFGTLCYDCHAQGGWRFNTSPDSSEMFEYNRHSVFITGFFTLAPNDEGVNEVVPAFAKLRRKGEGEDYHPLYAVGQGDLYFQRLQTFYELTKQRKEAGLCDPPGFPPIPEPQP